MDPLHLIRSSGRRFAVVVSRDTGTPMVWVLHRVASPEFLRLAMLALRAVHTEADRADELRSRLLGCKTDEDKARVTAELAAADGAQQMLGDPAAIEGMLGQADRLVMAGVHAFGIGRDDVELVPGLQPIGTKAEELCQPLDEHELQPGQLPTYFKPVRWAAPGDAQIDRLQIGEVNEQERMELATLIMEAFAPTKAVETFRGGSGAAGGSGPVGRPVRPKAERAAPVRRSARGRG